MTITGAARTRPELKGSVIWDAGELSGPSNLTRHVKTLAGILAGAGELVGPVGGPPERPGVWASHRSAYFTLLAIFGPSAKVSGDIPTVPNVSELEF